MTRRTLVTSAALLAFTLTALPADAHHSFAMFDNTKTVTIKGTVRDFQWTNPHTWIELVVVNAKTGQSEVWGLEGLPTPGMARRGWTRKSMKPGDKVEVDIYPLKNGANGGAIVKGRIGGKEIGAPPSQFSS